DAAIAIPRAGAQEVLDRRQDAVARPALPLGPGEVTGAAEAPGDERGAVERDTERVAVRVPRRGGDALGLVVAVATRTRKSDVVQDDGPRRRVRRPGPVDQAELVEDGEVVVVTVDQDELSVAPVFLQ